MAYIVDQWSPWHTPWSEVLYEKLTEAGLTVYATSCWITLYKEPPLHHQVLHLLLLSLFVFGATAPHWVRVSSFTRFLDHTRRSTTVGRTPLDEWSARRRDLYLTTHNTHNRQTSMPPVGFEPTISAGVRPQTYNLDRAATGTGTAVTYKTIYCHIIV